MMDEENLARTAKAKSAASTSNKRLLDIIGTEVGRDDDHEQEDDEDDSYLQQQLVASCKLLIVGIRYYNGVAHPGEFVTLVREPQNPYDGNAVRVDNLHGQKVGHIKREQAFLLAPLMDDHHNIGLQLEASIPYRGSAFNLPLALDLYASGDTPEGLIRSLQVVTERLHSAFGRRGLFQFRWKGPRPTDGMDDEERLSAAAAAAAGDTPAPKQVVYNHKLKWEAQAQELDGMFDKQSSQQLENLPPLQEFALSKLTTVLLKHQMDGVKWMVAKETTATEHPFYTQQVEKGKTVWLCTITNCSQTQPPTPIRSGILADEMGMGKTLSVIAMVLANPPASQKGRFTIRAIGDGGLEGPAAAAAAAGKGQHNEVIPAASYLDRFMISDLKLRLKEARLPLGGTKQQLVARCIEAMESGEMAVDAFPKLKSPLGSSVVSANETEFDVAVATLIVCPVSVMSNWMDQVTAHVASDTLRVGIYQGTERMQLLPAIMAGHYDVVLVSYHTLSSEYTKMFGKSKHGKSGDEPMAKKSKKESIFDVLFYRQCLDEAHTVRNPKSALFKAACQIQAKHKWCLTGTPFVNRCGDIHSLLSFLGVEPLGDTSVFKRAITVPMQNGGEQSDLAMATLRTTMAHIALRRSKATANIQLAAKTVNLASIEFPDGSPHKAVYDAVFGSLQLVFQAFMKGDIGSLGLKSYSSILESLLRMRQTCCSALLLSPERRTAAVDMWAQLQMRQKNSEKDGHLILTPQEGIELLQKLKEAFSGDNESNGQCECVICLTEMEQTDAIILKNCSHVFCIGCINHVISMKRYQSEFPCPLCRQPFQKDDLISESTAEMAATRASDKKDDNCSNEKAAPLSENLIGPSPKILALLEAIQSMKSDEKAVIFSQFTSFLDLIQAAMLDAGHAITRLDGSMSGKKRMEAVSSFSSDEQSSPRFILCSLHAAGTGINLTRGNHVYMMDTWFNSSVENQAMDRIHRIGQKRPVTITRFVMKGSVEERMVMLQEAKSLQAKESMQKLKAEEKRKARLADLQGLLLLHSVDSEVNLDVEE